MISLKKIKKQIILQMPRSWQEHIIRQQLVVPQQLSNSLQVKVASTHQELEQAFNLLYRVYLEAGFEKENSRQLRVLPQHLLPTTVTLVAKDKQQVVGTVSIVKNGILGMPMEQEFNLENFKYTHTNLAEISSFAIEKNYRRKASGQAFYALIKYVLEYCFSFADIHNLVIVIHPKDEAFYTGPLCFDDLNLPIVDYLGTPAKALTLNIQTLGDRLYKKETKNNLRSAGLYDFFYTWQFPQLIFPQRHYFNTNDPILDKNIFSKFFIERAKIMDYLKTADYFKIKLLYESTEFAQLFTQYEHELFRSRRRNFRFHVKIAGQLISVSNEIDMPIQVIEVFARGVIIRSPVNFLFNNKEDNYLLKINISPFELITLEGHCVWYGKNSFFFLISKNNLAFQKMIDHLMATHNFKIAS